MSKYRKFWVALGAACTVLATCLSDGALDWQEVAAAVVAFLGALGVYAVPNQRGVPRDDRGLTEVGLIVISVVLAVAAVILFLALTNRL